jgi:hypothetical protein
MHLARLLLKAANVKIAGLVGIDQLITFVMANTNRKKKMTDKEKLKEILKWCKINAEGWDPDQHDGPAEFKAICDLIEEKGYYKK